MTVEELAWSVVADLRKEILEAQRIRAQVIGFKITFVSAGVGVVAANQSSVPVSLMLVPAFAAVFFDLLIVSYSISIKRIGYYTRTYLEPKLRASSGWPDKEPLWEEYMRSPSNLQRLSIVANLGITLLVSLLALAAAVTSLDTLPAVCLSLVLAAFLAYDIWCFLLPRRLLERPAQVHKSAPPTTSE